MENEFTDRRPLRQADKSVVFTWPDTPDEMRGLPFRKAPADGRVPAALLGRWGQLRPFSPTERTCLSVFFAVLLLLLGSHEVAAQTQATCEIQVFEFGTSKTTIVASNAEKVEARLFQSDGQLKKFVSAQTVTGGKVDVDFTPATLQPGDKVEGTATHKTNPTGKCTFAPVPPPPGRFQTVFTAGQVLAKENADFSKPNMYLAFNLDRSWISPMKKKKKKDDKKKTKGWGINSFFDLRLTSIPVAGAETPDTGEAFLASRKAAVLQGGIYLPVIVTKWGEEQKSAFFIAPLTKIGFSTITEDLKELTRRPEPDDVHNFFGFGLRIGHYHRLATSNSDAHALENYLDVTWGKWESFETVSILDPAEKVMCQQGCIFRRGRRLALEGRLVDPFSKIFMVGFDANLGDGRDDVRFIFGARIDLNKFLGGSL